MIYDERMDKECISLCDAINAIPGLVTTESCCGHGGDKFRIFFNVHVIGNLSILLFHTYFRHCGCYWDCTAESYDIDRPVSFQLKSRDVGEKAYYEANIIANKIREYLINYNLLNIVKENIHEI